MFLIHFALLLILPTVAMNNGDPIFMLMFPIAAIGVMLNRHVMTQNSVNMPVRMNKEIAPFVSEENNYLPETGATRRAWLGDIIPVYIGQRLWRMFSIGDLFVFTGCGIAWIYITVLIFRGIA